MKFNLATLAFLCLFSHSLLATTVTGQFSSDHQDMECSGSWSHPFIPTTGELNHGTANGALLKNVSKSISLNFNSTKNELIISKEQLNGKISTHHLQVGKTANPKLKLENNKIILRLSRLFQSNWDYGLYLGSVINQKVVTIMSLNDNNDLVVENYASTGLKKPTLKKRCVLPRLRY